MISPSVLLALILSTVQGQPNQWYPSTTTTTYVPHHRPSNETVKSYSDGDKVPMNVKSASSVLPGFPLLEHYRYPFCQPQNGVELIDTNDTDIGGKVYNSPYTLPMGQNLYCARLCVSDLGPANDGTSRYPSNILSRAIRNDFRNNWVADGIPSAFRHEDDTTVTTLYTGGIPFGFLYDEKEYVYNHLSMAIYYNTVNGKKQVVRFVVSPFSVARKLDDSTGEVKILHPTRTCNPEISQKQPLGYDQLMWERRRPQAASGQVLFTYDVIWVEHKEITWENRWDPYIGVFKTAADDQAAASDDIPADDDIPPELYELAGSIFGSAFGGNNTVEFVSPAGAPIPPHPNNNVPTPSTAATEAPTHTPVSASQGLRTPSTATEAPSDETPMLSAPPQQGLLWIVRVSIIALCLGAAHRYFMRATSLRCGDFAK